MLLNPRLFPTILIVLDVLSAVVFATHGDIRKFGYWLSAAAITAFVTY